MAQLLLLLERSARIEVEISKVEESMKETIPLKDWRRLSRIFNLLRQQHSEILDELKNAD